MAEAGGKVAGADEDAVDAVDRGDLLDGVERLARLHLHQQAEFLLGALGVALDAAEAAGAGEAGDAAAAGRRIAHGGARRRRLLGRLPVRDPEALGPPVAPPLSRPRLRSCRL